MKKDLREIVQEKPFEDFAEWWPVGNVFSTFMSNAIHGEWLQLANNTGDLFSVKNYVEEYLSIVFGTESRSSLVYEFAQKPSPLIRDVILTVKLVKKFPIEPNKIPRVLVWGLRWEAPLWERGLADRVPVFERSLSLLMRALLTEPW